MNQIMNFGNCSYITWTVGLIERIKMTEQLHTSIDAKKKSRKQLYCRHTKLIADESTRMLKCELCGLWIEPFEFFMNWAQREVALHWQIDELERKKKELSEQIENLKKEKQKVSRGQRK